MENFIFGAVTSTSSQTTRNLTKQFPLKNDYQYYHDQNVYFKRNTII